jgi:hypothetical protein
MKDSNSSSGMSSVKAKPLDKKGKDDKKSGLTKTNLSKVTSRVSAPKKVESDLDSLSSDSDAEKPTTNTKKEAKESEDEDDEFGKFLQITQKIDQKRKASYHH